MDPQGAHHPSTSKVSRLICAKRQKRESSRYSWAVSGRPGRCRLRLHGPCGSRGWDGSMGSSRDSRSGPRPLHLTPGRWLHGQTGTPFWPTRNHPFGPFLVHSIIDVRRTRVNLAWPLIDCLCPLRSTSREIMRHGREKTSTTMAERREAFWLLAFGGSETPMGRGEDVGEKLVPLCQGRERP
jgi:hypothetical protein